MSNEKTQNALPTLKELVNDLEGYKNMDKFNLLLNQPCPVAWLKEHPYIKKKIKNAQGNTITVPYTYLPIDKVEYLLRRVFKRFKIEVLREGQYFNGVSVTVRVHYFNPVFNEWDFHDGIGAINLQVKSGSSPADLQNINNGALSMAFPLAKTLAVKDACDMFGKLFGADVNRDDTKDFTVDAGLKTNEELLNELVLILQVEGLTIPEEERMNIERIIEQKEVLSYTKAIKILNNHLPKNPQNNG